MSVLKNYIKGGVTPSSEELEEVVTRYPWFEAARHLQEGGVMTFDENYPVEIEKIKEESSGEIISRFLRKGDYKIIAEEGDVEDDVLIEADIDDEDDIVSEELAEIYLAQGLRSEAIEIYRKLSLLNSEKSIYFAEKIENIEKNN